MTTSKEYQEFRKSLNSIIEMEESWNELISKASEFYYFRYRELIKAVFSEQQAFEIVKTKEIEI